jgi:hypothetical protein
MGPQQLPSEKSRERKAMKTGTFQRLVLAMGMMVIAGCACRQPAAKETCPPPAPAQSFIFYDETGDPSEKAPPLSQSELGEIIDWVAARTSRPIWLIRVKPSYRDGRRAGVIAYLAPDEMTPRMRVGRAFTVREGQMPASPWQYVQVSLADRRFADQLTKPSVMDLPFSWPHTMDPDSKSRAALSREELIRFVDFLRQSSSYENPAVQRWLRGVTNQRPYELPILRIHCEYNRIHVATGYQHGGLWGWGWMITVERTPIGYEVTECGPWVS